MKIEIVNTKTKQAWWWWQTL